MSWVKQALANRRVQAALLIFVMALGFIAVKGLTFGVDFSGGTLFSIQLSEPIADATQKEQAKT